MSNANKGLDVMGLAYTGAVITASLVRQHLRLLRKRHFRSSREAAKVAGVDPSTVAKVENLKTWPNYDPGIGIVLKLLAAMKVPYAEFAAELGALDAKFDSLAQESPLQIPDSSAVGVGSRSALAEDATHGDRSLSHRDLALDPTLHELRQTLADAKAILHYANGLSAAVTERTANYAVAKPWEQATTARVIAPKRPRAARKRRRSNAGKSGR